MSKLDDILYKPMTEGEHLSYKLGDDNPIHQNVKADIKELMLELIGDVEGRETEDMGLKSWTPEDYKAFGKNELKIELRRKVEEL